MSSNNVLPLNLVKVFIMLICLSLFGPMSGCTSNVGEKNPKTIVGIDNKTSKEQSLDFSSSENSTREHEVGQNKLTTTSNTVLGHKTMLDPASQAKFQNTLTIPRVASADTSTFPGYEYYEMPMTEFQADFGLKDPVTSDGLSTTVWGYAGSVPGPTIIARSTGKYDSTGAALPLKVLWRNDLPETHLLPVDTTLRCGEMAPGCQPLVRTVSHLHGGHTDAASDGHPDAWFTKDFTLGGSHFDASMEGIYTYRNDQEAAGLWYHDHAIGVTRLNVYAGLSGMYLLRDENEKRLITNRLLPDYRYEIPLMIQDKSFYTDGSLAYPDSPFLDPITGQPLTLDPISGEPVASVEPEYFGNFIAVNGKIWPILEVEPRKYRFRVLNASNSRFYQLEFEYTHTVDNETEEQELSFYRIGTDGGLLNNAVRSSEFLLGPAERADIVIDFSDPDLLGKTIILSNEAPEPFPSGDPVDPTSAGLVMAIRVNKSLNENVPDSGVPRNLRESPIPVLTATPGVPERELVLVEEEDGLGRLLPMLGTVADGPMFWQDAITEKPVLGSTEIWSIVNHTPDTHPIHQHLVQFRILDRQAFDTLSFVPGQANTLKKVGLPYAPDAQEAGLKDTVQAKPGEIVRIIANYDLLGEYVWHCHILEHEDHEMMRPFEVVL